MARIELTSLLVEQLALDYNNSEMGVIEEALFAITSPEVAARGFLNYDEFLKICEWKTVRTKSLVRKNSQEIVNEISKIAFSCSETLRVKILTILQGVAIPTASAILTIWNSNLFTVYDYRVLSALEKLEHTVLTKATITGCHLDYYNYLDVARFIASDLKVSLRDLDKCLWMFDKYENR